MARAQSIERPARRRMIGATILLAIICAMLSFATAHAQGEDYGSPLGSKAAKAAAAKAAAKTSPAKAAAVPKTLSPAASKWAGPAAGGAAPTGLEPKAPPPTEVVARPRPMPDVRRMSLDKAQEVLRSNDLPQITWKAQHNEAPLNTVTEQSPPASTMIERSPPVQLVVSDGSVRVPDLAGQMPGEAQKTLGKRLRLVLGREQLSNRQAAGRILATEPAAGELVKMGSPVTYEVASDQVVVPDVRGQTPEQAGSILSESHLQLGQGTERFSRDGLGKILSTDPRPGARATLDGQVAYVLTTNRRAVPNVEGRSEAAAISELEMAGFPHETAPVKRGEVKVDVVDQQIPDPGQVVSIDTTVHLIMRARPLPSSVPASTAAVPATTAPVGGEASPLPPPVPGTTAPGGSEPPAPSQDVLVPSLFGLTVQEAQRVLYPTGLTLGTVSQTKSREPAGRILSTAPQAGARAPSGSSLSYVLSLGSGNSLRAVPPVVGLSETEAYRRLQAAGLDPTIAPRSRGAWPIDKVTKQFPSAGALAAADTRIRLTMDETMAPLLGGLAAGAVALVAAGVLGWSAAWPLRTKVAVALKDGLQPGPVAADPSAAGPEARLRWIVTMEPPVAEEATRTEATTTEGSRTQ